MSQNQLSFDDILSNRVGLGKYQYQVLAIIGLVDFIDGSESLYTAMLPTLIYKEWNLNSNEVALLGSIYYLGVFIGTLISGIANDNFGRRITLNFGICMEVLLILLVAFTQNIYEMVIVRFLQGFAYGFVLPISLIYIAEFSTKDVRGRAAIMLQFFFLIGKYYMLLLCSFFITNLSQGDWRSIAIFNSIPGAIIFILSLIFLDESPRFLISMAQYDKGIELINKIGLKNNVNYQSLTNEEINSLIAWQKANFKQEITDKDRFLGLFKEQQLPITWRLWFLSLTIFVIISGEMFLTTFIFDKVGAGLSQYVISFSAELPAIIIVFFMIDTKQFGRKLSINIAQICVIILLIGMYLGRETTLLIGVTIFKGFIRFLYLVFSPMVAESYNTMIRSYGIGFTYGIGRLGAGTAPFLFYPLFLIDVYLPYLVCAGIVTLVLLIAMISYPIDLTQKPLDLTYDQQKNNGDNNDDQDQLLQNEDNQYSINQNNEQIKNDK